MKRRVIVSGVGMGLALLAPAAGASVFVTEFSRGGLAGEFIEILNTGPAPVDLTGWSFNDANLGTGPFPIGALGTLAVGEAAIIAELDATTFRTNWGLSASVKVIGGNVENLGNGDDLRIFDAVESLVDLLTYPGGGAVVDGETWTTAPANYGQNTFTTTWVRSSSGDPFGSFASTAGYFGSPGTAEIPEPASLVGCALGALLLAGRRATR